MERGKKEGEREGNGREFDWERGRGKNKNRKIEKKYIISRHPATRQKEI